MPTGRGKHHRLTKHTVDAVVHDDGRFLRLQVDIRGAALDPFGHDVVDELDDRPRRCLARRDVDILVSLGLELDVVFRHSLEELFDRTLGAIHLVDAVDDAARRREVQPDRASGREPDCALAIEVVRIGRGDVDRARRDPERQDAVLPSERFRNGVARLVRDQRQVGDWHPEARRQRGQDVIVSRQAPLDRSLPEALGGVFRQLREARGIDQRLQCRQEPVVPYRAIVCRQLIPACLEVNWSKLTMAPSLAKRSTAAISIHRIRQRSRVRSTPKVHRPLRIPLATSMRKRSKKRIIAAPTDGYPLRRLDPDESRSSCTTIAARGAKVARPGDPPQRPSGMEGNGTVSCHSSRCATRPRETNWWAE